MENGVPERKAEISYYMAAVGMFEEIAGGSSAALYTGK
jgi:hypothetical protein